MSSRILEQPPWNLERAKRNGSSGASTLYLHENGAKKNKDVKIHVPSSVSEVRVDVGHRRSKVIDALRKGGEIFVLRRQIRFWEFSRKNASSIDRGSFRGKKVFREAKPKFREDELEFEMEKKPIERAFRKTLTRNRLVWFYSLAAITSFTIFVVFWCTNVFRDAVLSKLELRNGTATFAWWQRPQVHMLCKVYIFNYTNFAEFEAGNASKLRVQEVGPYVYKESLKRVNVVLHENETVSYQEERRFQWITGSPEDDVVFVPNIPLLSTIAFSRDIPFLTKVGLTLTLSTLNSKPFLQLPAGQFLWGYDDDIFRLSKPFRAELPFDKFGILAFKNGVDPDRITMYTGHGNHEKLGVIEKINGMDHRGVWGDEVCDKVSGTDGSMFPPNLVENPDKPLYLYAKDICRKIPFRYVGRRFVHGIPTLRYEVPKDAFTSTNTKDSCYCARNSEDSEDHSRTCPPAGIFNASACKRGSPLLISFPHFDSANKSLFEQIDGLSPEGPRQRSYLDLHPRLGITVGVWSKIQLNLEVRNSGAVPFSGKLKDGTILPLIWIDTGVESIPAAIKADLHLAHYVANAIEAGSQWCSLVGVILFFGALLVTLRRDNRIDEENSSASLSSSPSKETKLREAQLRSCSA